MYSTLVAGLVMVAAVASLPLVLFQDPLKVITAGDTVFSMTMLSPFNKACLFACLLIDVYVCCWPCDGCCSGGLITTGFRFIAGHLFSLGETCLDRKATSIALPLEVVALLALNFSPLTRTYKYRMTR